MKFLKSKEYEIELKDLSELLTKEGIKHELNPHPAFVIESQVKEILGYYPAGEWQIIIPRKGKKRLSIIRGMVSFGDYELYDGKDTPRTETAEEMVELIKEYFEK